MEKFPVDVAVAQATASLRMATFDVGATDTSSPGYTRRLVLLLDPLPWIPTERNIWVDDRLTPMTAFALLTAEDCHCASETVTALPKTLKRRE